MRPEQIVAGPRTPDSVGDWEDLLVRLEIAPRVVRNAVDEVADAAAAVEGLRAALRRERAVGQWLETASGIGAEPRRDGGDPAVADLSDLALRFASLRARTFAMVQRRGLEVWGWEGAVDEGFAGPAAPTAGRATAHQLLLALARADGELLAALRRSAGIRQAAC